MSSPQTHVYLVMLLFFCLFNYYIDYFWSYLWTRCQRTSCCDFYPDSLLPVRTGTARAVPGQGRPVPDQSRADSPLRYPGSEKRSWRCGAGRAAEQTPAGEQALSAAKEAPSTHCCWPGWAPEGLPGRGARRAAWGRAGSRWGTWSRRRQKPPSPSGFWWVSSVRWWVETSQSIRRPTAGSMTQNLVLVHSDVILKLYKNWN